MPAAESVKPVRVHITGCAPRSGTTLIMELFRDCFDIAAFGSHEISIFARPRSEPAYYCSKRPRDIQFVRPLLKLDENLRVVFMLRDPRDVIVSEHKLRPGFFWCHLGVWKRRYAIARSLRDHPHFMVVRYEDLATRPDAIQDELEAKLPFLRRTQRFSEWGRAGAVSTRSDLALGGVRPISGDSIGTWRNNKGRIVSQLAQYGPIDRELVDLGYETDAAWLAELENVTPDETPSVYADTRQPGSWLPKGPAALARSLGFHSRRAFDTARYALGWTERVDIDAS